MYKFWKIDYLPWPVAKFESSHNGGDSFRLDYSSLKLRIANLKKPENNLANFLITDELKALAALEKAWMGYVGRMPSNFIPWRKDNVRMW